MSVKRNHINPPMSDYISEEVCSLVLKRTPVKALLRFRSVCKGWKNLIDSSFFVNEHLSLQNPRFLIQPELTDLGEYPEVEQLDPYDPRLIYALNGSPQIRDCIFLGTHHGVACFYKRIKRRDVFYSKFLLWNPSICKLKNVDLPPTDSRQWEYIAGVSYFGFCINPSTKEFKFVMLNTVLGDSPKNVMGVAYSSSDEGNWEVIDQGEFGNWQLCYSGPPVMIEGVAYWEGSDKSEDSAAIVISFDFENKSFDSIEAPDLRCSPILSHWQGALTLMCMDQERPQNTDVYLRQQDRWVKRFSFSFESPIESIFWMVGEEGEVRILADNDKKKLFLRDTGCNGIIRLKDGFEGAYISYDFVDSLVFP